MRKQKIKELRIIIAGSRTFDDYETLKETVLENLRGRICPKSKMQIVSGKARGADFLGEKFAEEFDLKIKEFPADWERYGNMAGHIRNKEMVCYASEEGCEGILIAFWDGRSKGTKNMVETAYKYGLEVKIVLF